jgi:hypothetical protein
MRRILVSGAVLVLVVLAAYFAARRGGNGVDGTSRPDHRVQTRAFQGFLGRVGQDRACSKYRYITAKPRRLMRFNATSPASDSNRYLSIRMQTMLTISPENVRDGSEVIARF